VSFQAPTVIRFHQAVKPKKSAVCQKTVPDLELYLIGSMVEKLYCFMSAPGNNRFLNLVLGLSNCCI
jgi:hypothetical protein